MRIIKASAEIKNYTPNLEKFLEEAGRICYKSADRITKDSHVNFINMLKGKNHASVLEHGSISVLFIIDRGISHELVRHRLASYSQESTRYCNYSQDKFGKEITVIKPPLTREAYDIWEKSCREAEENYFHLLNIGTPPQLARNVLPISLKTEIMVTANPREWMHIFYMRIGNIHPQMNEVMVILKEEFKKNWPTLFGD